MPRKDKVRSRYSMQAATSSNRSSVIANSHHHGASRSRRRVLAYLGAICSLETSAFTIRLGLRASETNEPAISVRELRTYVPPILSRKGKCLNVGEVLI